MKIAVASDHAGIALRRVVQERLSASGHQIVDFGTQSEVAVDYPDFAAPVARAVRDRHVELGILVCGTGIGMSIAANKFKGVRAAVCTSEFEARASRAHNDANILCMGERVVGPGLACCIAEAFVSTAFEGGRHLRRVQKIADAENER
jgi:ribose 5-phosphate isomerase B